MRYKYTDENGIIQITTDEPIGYNYEIIGDDLEIPIVVPSIINQRQMKLQMLYDGIYEDSILAVINAISDETLKGKIMIEWQYANYFERFNENLIALWLQLGKTEEELNQFFINADKL